VRHALCLAVLLVGCGKPPPEVEYSARLLPTALNRLSIVQADPVRDVCVALLLVSPGASAFGVVLPPDWAVERAWSNMPASVCGTFVPPAGASEAQNGTGFVNFEAQSPCNVSMDVTLQFAAGQERVAKMDLKVQDNFNCR
jgi:hypothetical protein